MKQPAKTDVAVLILFFNRPKELGNLFEQVKLARPSKLYLYQDGPRNDSDLPRMEACRKLLDDEMPQLAAIGPQLVRREPSKVPGRIDLIKILVRRSCHGEIRID